ncbi:HET-domain-containing protein [Lentithecium fluviatile CBS 122367]|uniref:HET-domain-containing protein n=1 Tax=Lentithecium fluviatile CBS 122367 TaxID=1168545 RepID=A0A6G1IHJ6_9PLEO|nr:HET-domain-containing protein [Lentithecium fluviatile CBS 122367]
MDQIDPYTYDAIQDGQLRLLSFVQDGEFLSAVMKPFPGDGTHPFTALSYTWGLGSNESWPLHIGNQQLPVLGSLAPLVQALRAKGALLDGTWWWIDSICIDQANLDERLMHVRRMKRIYRDAQKVVVWLGPQSDDSDRAQDFIHFLNGVNTAKLTTKALRDILLENQYERSWIAFTNFFLRKWWTRIWTIQEFVIPTNISFWCGPRELTRDSIFAALAIADRCSAPHFKGSVAFHHAFHRRRAWLLYESVRGSQKPLLLSLSALAAYFCSNEATDDRDRIYGLSGLATESHDLEISYTWSVEEVYLRFAQSFIAKHKSLDIVAFAGLFSASSGSSLPSWVPDWRARVRPLVVPLMASQSSGERVGNLRPPRLLGQGVEGISYRAAGPTLAKYSFEGSALLAHGFIIDAVDGLAGTPNIPLTQSSGRHSLPSGTEIPPEDILESICRSLVLDRGDRYLQHPMPRNFSRDFIQLCRLLLAEKSCAVDTKFKDWFDSIKMLRFHGQSFEDIVRRFQDAGTVKDPESVPEQDEYVQDSFFGRFFDTFGKMSLRIMTTHNGRVGIALKKAQKGDLICVLFGCSIPLMVRKSEMGRFTIVGECFLDGRMRGEALVESNITEEVLCII